MSLWCTKATKGVNYINNQQNYNFKMKKLFTLVVFCLLLSNFALQGQTAVLTETGCNSVHVALTGACTNAYFGSGNQNYYGNWYFYYYQKATYQVTLTKLTGSPLSPITITIATDSYDWTGLEQGASYKIDVQPFLCTSQNAYDARTG